MKITTIGIDLAKAVFQIRGVDAHGKAVLRKQLRRSEMANLCASGTVPDRHGSLRQCPLLGKEAWRVRAYGEADGTAVLNPEKLT